MKRQRQKYLKAFFKDRKKFTRVGEMTQSSRIDIGDETPISKRFRKTVDHIFDQDEDLCPMIKHFVDRLLHSNDFDKNLTHYCTNQTSVLGNEDIDHLLVDVLNGGSRFTSASLLPCEKPTSFNMSDPFNISLFITIIKGLSKFISNKVYLKNKEHYAIMSGFYAVDDDERRNNLATLLYSNQIASLELSGKYRVTMLRTVYPYSSVFTKSLEVDFHLVIDAPIIKFYLKDTEETLEEYSLDERAPIKSISRHSQIRKIIISLLSELQQGRGLPFLN